MPLPSRSRRLAAIVTAFTVGTTLALSALSASAEPAVPQSDPTPNDPGRYIVTLVGKPIATYDGAVKGLAATKPTKGKRVKVTTKRAKAYRSYLEQQQDRVAARVGADADTHYSVSLNGFGTTLTPDQAKALERAPGVLSVEKDRVRHLTNDQNPIDYLKLSGDNGVWAGLGGKAKAGRGIVVGVMDSGYWPENPSFAGDPLSTEPPTSADPYRPYKVGSQIRMNKADGDTFVGVCQPGEDAASNFSGTECNSKVIGARYYSAGYKASNPPAERTDYLSPRDSDGHGSHTGSTAAGNADISATVEGRDYGTISGVAPSAKIAVYKVCWEAETGGCYNSDILDAIDDAITDGVDVINFSISGSDSVIDSVDLSFLSAASSGVFVSASAGNDGPGASTVNHVTPWVTTVAATTVAPYAATVVLGNGARYAGISTTVDSTVPSSPLVLSAVAKMAGAPEADASRCVLGTLDPAKVAGKIVVCDRGGNDRVEKSDEVKRAGGVGMVLVNLTEGSLDADTHAVPTVHLNVPTSLTVRAYAATPGATASLRKGNLTSTPIPYPQVAGFSSRGPSVGNAGDLLKPDLAAPGVATLAAYSPTPKGRDYDFLSGTSMAAPHVAGTAALYLSVHPTAAPMAIKSALMTTSTRTKNPDGSVSRDYHAQGAGNIRPDRMFNPGVVFNAGVEDWLGFIQGYAYKFGPEVPAVEPVNYNSPSIAIGKLVGTETVTRRVTAVKPGLYKATINLPGVNATVSPSVLFFDHAGQTKTIKVKFNRKNAPLGETDFGSLYLRGPGSTQARLPIAVKPEAVDAPEVINATGVSGSKSYQVKPGFSGSFPVTVYGLVEANEKTGKVVAKEPDAYAEFISTVPAGTKAARFEVASDNAAADIDMEVYRIVDGIPQFVGSSGSASGVESVTLVDPEPGEYLTAIFPFSDPPGQSSTTFVYRDFQVGPAAGNLTVTPANATAAQDRPLTLTAAWSGLTAGSAYLGWVGYVDGSGTFVEIN